MTIQHTKQQRFHPDERLKTLRHDNPHRVLGMAMIVDQRGIGARMVARYPTQPSPPRSSTMYATNHTNGSGQTSSSVSSSSVSVSSPAADDDTNEDLFYTLTPRQMAKLFRTKKSLCGQPMTLTVNGTVFCCRAILMEGEEATTAATTTTTTTTTTTAAIVDESSNMTIHSSTNLEQLICLKRHILTPSFFSFQYPTIPCQ